MAGVAPDVRIFPDLAALSEAAASLWVAAADQAILVRDTFLVALSGGSTPAMLYGLLASSPLREQVDWIRLQAFWGDERCVPPEDLQSNYRQARDLLFAQVPTPPANIHRVRTELDPDQAAEDYARVLLQYASGGLGWPRFDLVLLGLGEDGHTASLFPGSDPQPAGAALAVTAEYQGRPAARVTLTPAVFNSAREVLFLVSGQSKSQAVADVLNGAFRPDDLPAQRIHPAEGALIWLLDQDAAQLL